MKYLLGFALAAAAIVFGASSSAAPFKITGLETQASVVRAACQGNRRSYRNFNHCMRFIGNGAKYCARICPDRHPGQ